MAQLKFEPEFRVVGEYLGQFDSNILQLLLGIQDLILVPPVTKLFRSI